MPIVKFFGRILPSSGKLINAHGDFTFDDTSNNVRLEIAHRIDNSAVYIECKTESTHPWVLDYAYQMAYVRVRGIVDAVAFSEGIGLRLIMEEAEAEGLPRRPLNHGDPSLASICHLTAQEVISAIDRESRLMKPLNDLTDTLFHPSDGFINCERAIEGIGHLMSNDQDRKKRWSFMRENLNLTKDYLSFISNRSTSGRHGQTGPVLMKDVAEAQVRAWTVVNRFLEFRKRGNAGLREPEFRLL